MLVLKTASPHASPGPVKLRQGANELLLKTNHTASAAEQAAVGHPLRDRVTDRDVQGERRSCPQPNAVV